MSPHRDPEIIGTIQEVYEKLGGHLSKKEYIAYAADHPIPSMSTIRRVFGSWSDAVQAAGLPVSSKTGGRGPRSTVEDASALMARQAYAQNVMHKVYYDTKRPLTKGVYTAWLEAGNEGPAPAALVAPFKGSWQVARRFAGIPDPEDGTSVVKRYDRDAVIEALQSSARDGVVTSEDYKAWRQKSLMEAPSLSTVISMMGSWSTARRVMDDFRANQDQ